MKKILSAILLLGVCRAGFAQQPASRLSRDTMLIGDQVEWILDLKFAEGEEFYVVKPDAEPAPGVETIKPLEFDTVSLRKGQVEVEGRIILTAFDSGSYFLPPIIAAIGHLDGSVDTLFYDGPTMEVTTIPIDTATFEPFDIKGQIKYPLTFAEMLPWIGLALLLAALVYGICRFVKLRRENRTFFGKPIVKDPPHITALRSLEKIRSQKLWQSNKQKQFYTEVTDTLRLYISERYDISALEQTSAEIFAELGKEEISPALYEKLKELFATADYVKFAKHNASAEENEDVIPTAVRFVNETYMQQVEEEAGAGAAAKAKEEDA